MNLIIHAFDRLTVYCYIHVYKLKPCLCNFTSLFALILLIYLKISRKLSELKLHENLLVI